MADEFKFTKNSAASVVKGELVSAQTKAIIAECDAAAKDLLHQFTVINQTPPRRLLPIS
jgi:hypothetical protein